MLRLVRHGNDQRNDPSDARPTEEEVDQQDGHDLALAGNSHGRRNPIGEEADGEHQQEYESTEPARRFLPHRARAYRFRTARP